MLVRSKTIERQTHFLGTGKLEVKKPSHDAEKILEVKKTRV